MPRAPVSVRATSSRARDTSLAGARPVPTTEIAARSSSTASPSPKRSKSRRFSASQSGRSSFENTATVPLYAWFPALIDGRYNLRRSV